MTPTSVYDPLPSELYVAFKIHGPKKLNKSSEIVFHVLVAKGNYDPERARELIESTGLKISGPDMLGDNIPELFRKVILDEEQMPKPFSKYESDNLIPSEAGILVQTSVNK